MLDSPVNIAILLGVSLVIFGPKAPPPWVGKFETYEKNPNSPLDPFPLSEQDTHIHDLPAKLGQTDS